MESEFISVLQKKFEGLREKKEQKEMDIKVMLNDIEVIQKSMDSIVQLLQIEGVNLDEQLLKGVSQATISDVAYDYLNNSPDKKSMHYVDILNGLLADGKPVSGKNPAANLLTHISRDKRFVRVSPGTYGLGEWGLEAPKSIKKKKARKTVSRKDAK